MNVLDWLQQLAVALGPVWLTVLVLLAAVQGAALCALLSGINALDQDGEGEA